LRFRFVFVSPGFSSLGCGGASPGLSLRSWCLIELLTLIKNTFRGSTPWVFGLRFRFVFVFSWVRQLGLRRGFSWSLIEVGGVAAGGDTYIYIYIDTYIYIYIPGTFRMLSKPQAQRQGQRNGACAELSEGAFSKLPQLQTSWQRQWNGACTQLQQVHLETDKHKHTHTHTHTHTH